MRFILASGAKTLACLCFKVNLIVSDKYEVIVLLFDSIRDTLILRLLVPNSDTTPSWHT